MLPPYIVERLKNEGGEALFRRRTVLTIPNEAGGWGLLERDNDRVEPGRSLSCPAALTVPLKRGRRGHARVT